MKENETKLTLDIDKELHKQLRMFVAEHDTKINKVVTEALKDFFIKHGKADDKTEN